MKEKLNNEEIKNISLKILLDVSDFCEQHNITYYLACGTLLGAAIYKGYIPWDDDIDIMMPRNDYDRFIKEYKSEEFKVLNPHTGMYFYSKVYDKNTILYEKGMDYKKYKPIGVNIDVFPLDGIVNDDKIINKIRKKNNILEMLLRLSNQPIFYRKNKLKAINRIIPRIIGSKNIVKLIEKNCQTYKYEDSDYVIRYKDTPNGFTGAMSKDMFEITKIEFENNLFNAPKDYDKWLKIFYREDYMTYMPPLEEKRTHDIEAYIIID